MNNTVYALIIYYPYESANVLGIYTSIELAEKNRLKCKKNDDSNGYNVFKIEEYELNE